MGSLSYANFIAMPKFRGFESSETDVQELIDQYLDEAEQDINEDYYGSKTVRAIMLLAAHKYELSPAKAMQAALLEGKNPSPINAKLAVTGALSSISVSHGSNSASFAPMTGMTKEEYLVQTPWGQELLQIMRTLPVLGFVW